MLDERLTLPPHAVHSLSVSFVKRNGDSLIVTSTGRRYNLNQNVRVLGFGKAVIGMVAEVDRLLRDHITEGLVSLEKADLSMSSSVSSVFQTIIVSIQLSSLALFAMLSRVHRHQSLLGSLPPCKSTSHPWYRETAAKLGW